MSPTVRFARLGYFAHVQTGITIDASREQGGKAEERPYLRVANVQAGWLDLDDVKTVSVPPFLADRATLKPGDVLMTEGGDLDKLGRGTVWHGEIPGCLHQNHIFAVRPHSGRLDPAYLALVTQSSHARSYFERTGVKTTNLASTSSSKILDLPVPVLPIERQRAIVDFLEREAARIESLIAIKRRMIEAIEERFDSAIYWAVTRGFDTSVGLKEVRLGWAQELPNHWGTPTVGTNFEVVLGKMLNPDAQTGPDQFEYVRNQDVQWDRLELNGLPTMHFDLQDRLRLRLMSGDLLVCEGGEVGRAALWEGQLEDCYFQKAVHRVRSRGNGNPRFLMFCLRAAARQHVFEVEGNVSTIAHLTLEKLKEHRFPWPLPHEQAAIVDHLDHIAAWQRRFSCTLNSQITLLHEHRQALISAAVTGELDVAGATA